ncbi:unnamed protein product, partial [Rotaria sordida]
MASDIPASNTLAHSSPLSSIQNQATQTELTSSSSSPNNDRTSLHKHKSRHIDEELDELNSSSSSLNNQRTPLRNHKSLHIDEQIDELNSSSSSLNNHRTPARKHKSRSIDERIDDYSSSSRNNDRTSVRKHKSRHIDEQLDELNSSSSLNNERTSVRKHTSLHIHEQIDELNSSSSSLNNHRTPARKHKSRSIDERIDDSSSYSRNTDRTSVRKHKSRHIDEKLDESYFRCNFCGDTPDNLSSSDNQIFIFKQNMNNQLIGYPVLSNNMNQNNTSWICNSCNNSTNNLEMDIHKQGFLKCPSCLITCINPKVENNPLDNHICLRDMDDKEYNYGATALLCFSAYSDNVGLVKKKSNKYVQLIGDAFSEETLLTF